MTQQSTTPPYQTPKALLKEEGHQTPKTNKTNKQTLKKKKT